MTNVPQNENPDYHPLLELFANGTLLSVAYGSSLSRVVTVTDALSQDYTYNSDNSTATISDGGDPTVVQIMCLKDEYSSKPPTV
jgi:hypothetical protein